MSKKPNFSQANGIKPIPSPLGLEELSYAARNNIWSDVYELIKLHVSYPHGSNIGTINSPLKEALIYIHTRHFERPIDEFNNCASYWIDTLKTIIFNFEFNEVFDLIQELMNYQDKMPFFKEWVRRTFDENLIAYSINVEEGIIMPRVSEEEEEAVHSALQKTSEDKFSGAKAHLKKAAENLTSNTAKDSIRESIHAVESVMKVLTNSPSATFGVALTQISKVIELNGALKKGFESIYGYTNTEHGIRHSLLDDENVKVTKDEAIFMLSSCASMINYLINKYESVEALKELNQESEAAA